MNRAHADDVRALIAHRMLGPPDPVARLGDVTLHQHQREGLSRVRRLLRHQRGALLADDVGLGKTFVALAAARDYARTIVIAPAALRDGWTASAAASRVTITFASVQSLSRTDPPPGPFDLVIIDEAHHLRTRGTKRFARAVELCRNARVLLLTATPVQNRLADLRAILSLFLGERAFTLPPAALAELVIRRIERDLEAPDGPALPRVRAPASLPEIDDVDCLDRLVALPPPLPPLDGGDGGVLLIYSLVRQWASSRAALVAALRRRVSRAHAMEDALLQGRRPTATELAAWCTVADTQQLAFPELVVTAEVANVAALLHQVRRHAAALRDLLAWLRSAPDIDGARARVLADVRQRHAGARIVAFSEYTETVTMLYRMLAPAGGVALLTHEGGRVAGGRQARREILRQFGPSAAPVPRERVDLLLTTDLLSEGVDLQGASVIVHLDLTWNPARLEQRVGRLRRIGSRNQRIAVYVMPPPAGAERLLQLERRLRAKLGVAAAAIGAAGSILPRVDFAGETGDARIGERIASTLARWQADLRIADTPVVAAVRSHRDGAIVCVEAGGDHSLAVVRDGKVSDAPADVADALVAAGADIAIDPDLLASTRRAIDLWLARRDVTDVICVSEIGLARTRRSVLRRVDTILRRAPRHAHARLAPLVHVARTAAAATLSAGAERVLHQLASAALDDDAWLHAMRDFARLNGRRGEPGRVVAVLLLARG